MILIRKFLDRLFESSTEPQGKVAAMRKLALAPEPVCPPLRLTQPVEKQLEKLERIGRL